MSNAETIATLASKQSRAALERVENVERALKQVIESANAAFERANTQMQQMADVIDVLVELAGTDVITAKLVEKEVAKSTARVEAQKAQVEAALLQGTLKVVDTVTDQSLIVFKEYKGETALENGRNQFMAGQLKPEFKAKVVGQGVGYKLDAPTVGHTFEVVEIYEPVAVQPTLPTETLAEAAPESGPDLSDLNEAAAEAANSAAADAEAK